MGIYKGRRLTVLECSLLEVPHCVTYVYSGTSDNGHSEEWTTSLQWTHCYIVHTFLPPNKGQPLNNGQNARPQCVHYSEVSLYNRYAFEGEKMCKIMWAVGTIVWQPVNFLKLFPTTQEE